MAYKRTVRPKKEDQEVEPIRSAPVDEPTSSEPLNRAELPPPAPSEGPITTANTDEVITIDVEESPADIGYFIKGRFESRSQAIWAILNDCSEDEKEAIIDGLSPQRQAALSSFVIPDINTPPEEKTFCGDKDAQWIFMSNEIERREISRQIVTMGLNIGARNPSGCLVQCILYEGAKMVSNSIIYVPGARINPTPGGGHLLAVKV